MKISLRTDVQKLASPLLMWGLVFLGVILIYLILNTLGAYNNLLFSAMIPNGHSRYLFIPALLYWIYFFTGAMLVHRDAIRSVSGITKLIKTGAYSAVRHPIYSADIVLSWGIFFLRPSLFLLASVLWMNLMLFFWMKLEEKLLLEKFGKEYEEYMKDVPMSIPRFKKKKE